MSEENDVRELEISGPQKLQTDLPGHETCRPDVTTSQDKPILLEARGIWVTRWDYRSAEDVRDIVKTASSAGFNQLYFQVRGAADACYRSSKEPWATELTGRLGRDPGWDPLELAVREAHRAGLELHAWINLCTAWAGGRRPPRSRPAHILRTHPRWRVVNRRRRSMPRSYGYVFVCPAHPGFRAHVEAVVAEIVSSYSVDGLHLDYARYPGADTSYDRMSNRRYRKARRKNPELSRAAWQRIELTRLVHRLKHKAKQLRPHVEVSAAVCGIYKNRWGWKDVLQGHDDYYQDSHLWARMQAVDVLIPMIYWKPTHPPGGRADFLTLVQDFSPLGSQVKLLAGINVEAGDFHVLEQEVRISREHRYAGVVLFSYQGLKKRNWFEKLKETVFRRPAVARVWVLEIVSWSRLARGLWAGLRALVLPGWLVFM